MRIIQNIPNYFFPKLGSAVLNSLIVDGIDGSEGRLILDKFATLGL